MMAGCRRLCLSSSWPKRLGVVDFGGLHQTQTRNPKASCTDPGCVLEVFHSQRWLAVESESTFMFVLHTWPVPADLTHRLRVLV